MLENIVQYSILSAVACTYQLLFCHFSLIYKYHVILLTCY